MRQLAHRIRSILKPDRPDHPARREPKRGPKRLTSDQHQTLQRNLAALLRSKEHLTQAVHESRG
jgi:hypothetical protein